MNGTANRRIRAFCPPYELAKAWRGRLHVVALKQGPAKRPKPAAIQRICALRGSSKDRTIE